MSETLALDSSIGKTLIGLRRVFYVYQGTVEENAGPLELTFNDGTVVVLNSGGDGEALSVMGRAWIDPFQEPLSEENRAFVKKSGKWTAFDVTAREPYNQAIGQLVGRLDYVTTTHRKIVGVQIQLESAVIHAVVGADELLVEVI